MNHTPDKQSLKALARQVLREAKPTPEVSYGVSQLSHPRGKAKPAENCRLEPTVPLSHSLGMGQVGHQAETTPFLNANPDGDCIACKKPITDADKPDAIPVVGGAPNRIAGYLHGTVDCYRAWFFKSFGKYPKAAHR